MGTIYVVWNIQFAPNVDEPDAKDVVDRSVGHMCPDEEDARDTAFRLIGTEAAERVMIIALRPWTAPELVCTLGEFSGTECFDWYGTQEKLKRSYHAAVASVAASYDLVRKAEVNV